MHGESVEERDNRSLSKHTNNIRIDKTHNDLLPHASEAPTAVTFSHQTHSRWIAKPLRYRTLVNTSSLALLRSPRAVANRSLSTHSRSSYLALRSFCQNRSVYFALVSISIHVKSAQTAVAKHATHLLRTSITHQNQNTQQRFHISYGCRICKSSFCELENILKLCEAVPSVQHREKLLNPIEMRCIAT